MSRVQSLSWRLLILGLLILTTASFSRASAFEPIMTMLGIAQTRTIGEPIDWMVTFSNTGDLSGQAIVISNIVGDGLQVDSVQFSGGTTSIDGRTVTVSLPTLAPQETIQFIVTTTIVADGDLSNTACLSAVNLNGETCVRGLPIEMLPATGEVPYWRQSQLWITVMIISASSLLLGLGLLGYRNFLIIPAEAE